MNGNGHVPVLIQEVLDYLDITRKGLYIDCTLGLGGHSLEILKRNPQASLIGFDIDEKSLLEAKKRMGRYSDRISLFHSDFRYLPDLRIDFQKVKGILLDLGLSSYQLDSPERGFSYNLEGPLDMRMDLRNKVTAFKIIHRYSEYRLTQIFRDFGEIKPAKKLAREIVSRRKVTTIETTTELRRIIEEIFRWRPQKGKIHPAAKVFQALRIEINQELKGLSEFLERISKKLPKKSRIAVISFHSLEDRIIKHTFRNLAFPEDYRPFLKILTKKPIIPSEDEIVLNFRSRSAKLRVAERI